MRSTTRAALAAVLLGASTAGLTQPAPTYRFDLPASGLSEALRLVALDTGLDLVAPAELLEGGSAPALHGMLTPEEAIAALLEGSGLGYSKQGKAIVIVRAAGAAAAPAGDIVVTGTRIRGAPVAAPVIRLGAEAIRDRGQATLAEAVRAVPQNFGGGQNPAIGNNVPAASGVNVGSASSVNLRGLGSDATLTLINGHRISYSASRQAVDISAIPLGAVERVEIVPDGASALYGSDAVAGVVNLILRRDFDGVETRARVGGAMDGGGFEQRYGIVAGKRWSGGGLVGTVEYGRTAAIRGSQRSYTAASAPALTLVPAMRNHSATLSAHQALGENVSVELDAIFNDRRSRSAYALNAAGNIKASGAELDFAERAFALAPTLRWSPGGDWRLFLTGSYGSDRTHYDVRSYFQGQAFEALGNCYCNRVGAAELGGEGKLLDGPGGPVRLAVGGGYRTNRLVRFNGAGASTNVAKTQDSIFAYGELGIPLVSPDRPLALVHRLSLSAAARYENYPGIGDVMTPKLGAIYAPSADMDLKASWGRSFRAPTLYQQYQAVNAVLAPAAAFGGSGLPANATALLIQGGSKDLKPERANNWSATAAFHPRVILGLNLELSWFRTHYRDRVVTPIPFLSQALRDPSFASLLTANPSPALQAAVIASANSLGNATGAPYDPATVAVLIDDRNVNAGFQQIQGADLLLSFSRELGAGLGQINASGDVAYLKSRQQVFAGQPVTPLAGRLFNPPHWKARGDLAWTRGMVTLGAAVTRVGAVTDARRTPAVKVRGMTIFDLTARVKGARDRGPLRGLDASLTVQNLFNARPARIAVTLPSDAPYDSTNQSPVGHFLAVSIAKTW